MIETDAVVIGAGPVGLFQAFQLGLQEIPCHIVDALPHPGGQCAELYPHKPIYDIPGLPVTTGQDLTEQLLTQLAPFKVPMHLGHAVEGLHQQADGRWLLTAGQQHFITRTVFVAAGVGAFVPRKPPAVNLDRFEGGQVHYHRVPPEKIQGRQIVVLGGEDAAIETALHCAEWGHCTSVTLVHRTDRFKAEPELLQRLEHQQAQGTVRVVVGQPVGLMASADGLRLEGLQLATTDDTTASLPVEVLLPRLGLAPKLGPIADWGLALERKQLVVNTETFATLQPGVFAVGDINAYPGKRKLILCGFHEATLAAFGAAAYLRPTERVLLQYTTTSPRLHELLGVRH
jgi:thioredoxin reductase (NADPH)